ncbi:Microsomal dipeptidase [Hyphomicrobiales bacterium]|nr:Microsomal dipeptidase [Hyphomicrobiales bacterium]CAH1663508.1 Microsomal dipeptidase [Hyphomicrobiales bacterium]
MSEVSHIVIDGLNCASMNRDQMVRTHEGGITALNYTCLPVLGDLVTSLTRLQAVRDTIVAMPEVALIVSSTADIRAAHETGRVGVILGTQNSTMVEADVALLGAFRTLGLRILQPTYNEQNAFGYGASFDATSDLGMTEAGHAWLAEMHKQHLIVDLSHCGPKTTDDYLAAAKEPVVISHSNAYALCPNPRNKSDAQARAVAETGGLIGAVMWSPLVKIETRPTLDDYIDHVEHLVKVAGIEHVSFATDLVEPHPDPVKWDKAVGPNGEYPNITGILGDWYRYETRLNTGFQSMRDTPGIWEAMRRRGFSASDIEKIASGNWLRVMRDIWGA